MLLSDPKYLLLAKSCWPGSTLGLGFTACAVQPETNHISIGKTSRPARLCCRAVSDSVQAEEIEIPQPSVQGQETLLQAQRDTGVTARGMCDTGRAHDRVAKDRDSHFSLRFLSDPPLWMQCVHGRGRAWLALASPCPSQSTGAAKSCLSPQPALPQWACTSPRPLAEHSPAARLWYKCSSQEGPQTHLHVQGAVLDQAISSLHMYSLVTAAFDPILFVSQ